MKLILFRPTLTLGKLVVPVHLPYLVVEKTASVSKFVLKVPEIYTWQLSCCAVHLYFVAVRLSVVHTVRPP